MIRPAGRQATGVLDSEMCGVFIAGHADCKQGQGNVLALKISTVFVFRETTLTKYIFKNINIYGT